MLGVVVKDLVVRLVGQDQQLVLAGQLRDLLENLAAVHRAGGLFGLITTSALVAFGDLGFKGRRCRAASPGSSSLGRCTGVPPASEVDAVHSG